MLSEVFKYWTYLIKKVPDTNYLSDEVICPNEVQMRIIERKLLEEIIFTKQNDFLSFTTLAHVQLFFNLKQITTPAEKQKVKTGWILCNVTVLYPPVYYN